MRAPLKPALRDVHRQKTSERARNNTTTLLDSDLFLQRGHWVGLHDGLCRLRRNLDLLAENVPHSCFCGWFRAGLNAAQTWNREEASLFHFFCGDFHQAVEDLRTLLRLQAMLICDGFEKSSLGHGLCGSLHRLHGGHIARGTQTVV